KLCRRRDANTRSEPRRLGKWNVLHGRISSGVRADGARRPKLHPDRKDHVRIGSEYRLRQLVSQLVSIDQGDQRTQSMSCYISSNANRFYTAVETAYGEVPAITAANRIVAVKLSAKQSLEKVQRKDKTGTRTFPGFPGELRTT